MSRALEAAVTQLEAALAQVWWGQEGSASAPLAPVEYLLDLVEAHRELGASEKETAYAAGVELNRWVLDSLGVRHNRSVDDANACCKAGQAVAAALLAADRDTAAEVRRAVLEGVRLAHERRAGTAGTAGAP